MPSNRGCGRLRCLICKDRCTAIYNSYRYRLESWEYCDRCDKMFRIIMEDVDYAQEEE